MTRANRGLGLLGVAIMVLGLSSGAQAQQRPLITQDPEPIGAGRVLVEGGVEFTHDQRYPVSGLKGNLWRLPTIGLSFGISSIAELQIDGGLYDRLDMTHVDPACSAFSPSGSKCAPLGSLLTVTGTTTHDFEDIVVGTKIRLLSESPGRPAFGIRFATKLPNASNESGLGLDTTDFFASILGAKTVQSVRVVGNVGLAILGDPTNGNRQNDDVTYGLSFARALTEAAELVAEANGRVSIRNGVAFPGTETHGLLKFGGRYTRGPVRVDSAIFFGLTTLDPTVGFTSGFTYVFNAFRLP